MCWDCYDNKGGDPYKIFTQGGVPVEDFDEVPFRHPKRKKKKDKETSKKGCSGNDYGPHVYVWTTEQNHMDLFSQFYGYQKYEKKICVGCNRRAGTRKTERYEKIKLRKYNKMFGGNEYNVKRGEPIPRYGWNFRGRRLPSFWAFNWEFYDDKFVEFRNNQREKYGLGYWYERSNRYDWN